MQIFFNNYFVVHDGSISARYVTHTWDIEFTIPDMWTCLGLPCTMVFVLSTIQCQVMPSASANSHALCHGNYRHALCSMEFLSCCAIGLLGIMPCLMGWPIHVCTATRAECEAWAARPCAHPSHDSAHIKGARLAALASFAVGGCHRSRLDQGL